MDEVSLLPVSVPTAPFRGLSLGNSAPLSRDMLSLPAVKQLKLRIEIPLSIAIPRTLEFELILARSQARFSNKVNSGKESVADTEFGKRM
jgi:hypothetical protein